MAKICSKCKRVENQVNELNPGQHLLAWKIVTPFNGKFLTPVNGKLSLKKECVYELFNQKRLAIAITKSVITYLGVFYHSKYVVLRLTLQKSANSLLHLERIYVNQKLIDHVLFWFFVTHCIFRGKLYSLCLSVGMQ